MYLNVIELAESLGVSEDVVSGWVRHEGLPCVPDRGRLLFDRAEVATWAASKGLAARAGFLATPQATRRETGGLVPLVQRGGIWRGISASQVLDTFAEVLGRIPGTTPAVRGLLEQRVRAGRGISWAPVGGGCALPHLRTPVALGRDAGLVAILLLSEGIVPGEPAPDEVPVSRLLFFVAPTPRAHLEMLGELSFALTRGGLQRLLLGDPTDEAILQALATAGVARDSGGNR